MTRSFVMLVLGPAPRCSVDLPLAEVSQVYKSGAQPCDALRAAAEVEPARPAGVDREVLDLHGEGSARRPAAPGQEVMRGVVLKEGTGEVA